MAIYRRFRAADEPALAQIESFSFAADPARMAGWFDLAGRDQIRVVEVDGVVVGGLLLAPMGVYLQGRALPTWGVAGVGVLPERRGEGVGRTLMAGALREGRAAGVALSSLFASTRSLYRRVGFGEGGLLRFAELPTDSLTSRGMAAGGWRRAEDRDHAAVDACYRRRAATSNGLLDRGPYVWARIRRGETTGTWVRERQGEVVAYVILGHGRRSTESSSWTHLEGVDWGADTLDDLRSVVAFLHGFRSMARTTRLAVQVDDPLLDVLDEPRWAIDFEEAHMLRILDVARVLEGRGYGATQRGQVVLEVVDELLPDNAGPWTLQVERGRGSVVRGGIDGVRIDVRGLASLVAGYAAPATLVRRGLLDADVPELALLAADTPSCLDFY